MIHKIIFIATGLALSLNPVFGESADQKERTEVKQEEPSETVAGQPAVELNTISQFFTEEGDVTPDLRHYKFHSYTPTSETHARLVLVNNGPTFICRRMGMKYETHDKHFIEFIIRRTPVEFIFQRTEDGCHED